MIAGRITGRRLLVLNFDGASCAITASQLVAIDHDGSGARVSIEGPVLDLADYLPDCTSSEPPVRLIVEAAGYRRGFRTRARLELVEPSALFRMPRVVRDCGCAPWLRGVVLLVPATTNDSPDEGERPALWIDLSQLALAAENQHHKETLR